MKVLIVDDSTFMRAILKDLVLQSKWKDTEVIEASDGSEAVIQCQTQKPDLILLDIVMPGKDGIEVLKEIGYSQPSVVIVSSIEQKSVLEQAKLLGAKDYIVKPFEPKLVIESLNKLFPEAPMAV
jgi:two-component system chemotaxis response regulator CheY